jgi:UDP-N-acetylmuramoyl-L-alanyl-D-glutamate--2,6-diaminopimelate ligase
VTAVLDRLSEVVEVLDVLGEIESLAVTGVTHDSRAVQPGSLFCCVRGARVDGHDLAGAAVQAGAAALVVERRLALDVPQLVVPDTRAAMGPLAARFWGDPSRQLDVFGVTGTNGKTTTVHLLGAILTAAGRPATVIGTLTGARTTPEATELQASLAQARAGGGSAVAMEVSSHGLAMHRVDGTWFRVGVFTNLSPDHLDFHADLEDYFAAKSRLFAPERCQQAVINADDPYGRRLLATVSVPAAPYSLDDADDVRIGALASTCRWRGVDLTVPLGGRFNLPNALAAATAATTGGVPLEAVVTGLAAAPPVPGRFEPVTAGQPYTVLVDYAHTPDGLRQLLTAAREVAGEGRVLVVFGCGGDRDTTKRGPMGAIATAGADLAVVTNDNPRSEDPAAIVAAVLDGIEDRSRALVEPDRRAAIALALGRAAPGDVVVIAGKGHETTQTTGEHVTPFDDRVVARELLEDARW